MIAGGNILTGDRALDRKLRSLSEKGSQRALAAGVRAALPPIAKEMRRGITGTGVKSKREAKKTGKRKLSSGLKRAARKSVGTRWRKGGTSRIGKTTQRIAKVGLNLAKRKKSEHSGPGVGIGPANIHWFVLGTKERTQANTGRKTGKIDPIFKHVAQEALNRAFMPSMAAAQKATRKVIEREARKKV